MTNPVNTNDDQNSNSPSSPTNTNPSPSTHHPSQPNSPYFISPSDSSGALNENSSLY